MYFQFIPTAEANVNTLMNSIDKVIINPLILFLFSLALVYFLYGVARYLMNPGSEEIRKDSKSHMLWGVVGMFIMISVFFIMRIILSTLNVKNVQIDENTGKITVGQPIDLSK